MLDENIKVINQVKDLCQVLKLKIIQLGKIEQVRNIEYLECLILELDSYNRLLLEKYDSLQEVNLWPSIKSCVKSSNQNHNKKCRPHVIVNVVDQTNDTNITFNAEKNSDDKYGNDNFVINHCFSIMQLAPTLLIDNAFKYCNPGGYININIERDEILTSFSFENLGPRLNEEELSLVWEADIRGDNAKATKIEGQGLGLFLFRIIMNLHSHLAANYRIDMDNNIVVINNIEYSLFRISFSILNKPYKPIDLKDLSTLKPRLLEFITHQYIRIMPRICKLSQLLFYQIYVHKDLFGDEICNTAYNLKKIIMSYFIFLQKGNENFYHFSENMQATQIRLDKYLLYELEYFTSSFNMQFKYKIKVVSGEKYLGKPTISPYIDVFVYDFVSWLVTLSGVNDIDIIIDRKNIEIVSEETFLFNEESVNIWARNLEICGIEIQMEEKSIRLS